MDVFCFNFYFLMEEKNLTLVRRMGYTLLKYSMGIYHTRNQVLSTARATVQDVHSVHQRNCSRGCLE